jgi:septal ring factor EnvC (AmiA/AmiB activator)
MFASTETKALKSPLRKLVQFFRRSRDRWKQKHQELKLRCKRLATQVAAVEKSREHWRTEVRVLRRRVAELERQLGEPKVQPRAVGSL